MKKFAVLQLSGCAGYEMSLFEAEDWPQHYELTHLPLVISSHDIPEVQVLLVSGGVRTDEDLFNLRRSVKKAKQVVAVGTCAISGGVASLGDREEIRELFAAEESIRDVPHLLPKCHPIDTFVNVSFYLPGCPAPITTRRSRSPRKCARCSRRARASSPSTTPWRTMPSGSCWKCSRTRPQWPASRRRTSSP